MNKNPCNTQINTECQDCNLSDRLMCRYDSRDTLHFFVIVLPFFFTTIAGVIHGGHGWWLLGWLAYSLFFFFVWEARVLCSHCPYWAEEGRVLRCHANYGVIKIWKERPGPMNRSEKNQFLIGVILWIMFPLVLLVLEREFLLASIGLISAASGAYLLKRNVCTHCINFSCPLNGVPKDIVDNYLRQNQIMRQAWEDSGYKIENRGGVYDSLD